MRHLSAAMIVLIALAFTLLEPVGLLAQSNNEHLDNPFVPKLTVSAGYAYVRSNAPPGYANGFSNNGGGVAVGYAWRPWLTLEGEFTGTHGNQIGSLGQNLTLTTYTFGPQFTKRRRGYTLFAQALFGGAHASDSYFPTATGFSTTASSYAIEAGAGADFDINDHFGVRLPSVQYLHTGYSNGVNSSENHLVAIVGLTVKLGGKFMYPVAVPMPVKRHVSLTCSASARTLQPGETLEVTAISKVEPAAQDVDYTWTSEAGPLFSSNSAIATLDTTGLTPGRYKVVGHATLSLDVSVTASCDVPFRIAEVPHPLPLPPPVIIHDAAPAVDDTEFHTHVRDLLFDYDKSNLRPDTAEPMAEAVHWLEAHPKLHVIIGGYSDERGTTEYNIALGLRRATTVHDALVTAGIPPDRLQVVSYGKGAQVCVAADEGCFQRNRRVTFLIQP